MQARVKVRIKETGFDYGADPVTETRVIDTTVGRALLWRIVPEGLSFDMVNQPMVKKAISRIINQCYRVVGLKSTVVFADRLMYTGYEYSTKSGSSIGVNDFEIPDEKASMLDRANAEVTEIEEQYAAGLVTQAEKYNKVIDIWARVTEDVAAEMLQELRVEEIKTRDGSKKVDGVSFSLYLEGPSAPKGVFGTGTIAIAMYRLDTDPLGKEVATQVKEWVMTADEAVQAAQNAFDGWSSTNPQRRARVMFKLKHRNRRFFF